MKMADFSVVQAEVANLTSVTASVVAAFNGVADQVEAAVAANDAGDNSQLATLASDIRAQADSLAAAVAANTPAAPTV
jgi:hypothetical protein